MGSNTRFANIAPCKTAFSVRPPFSTNIKLKRRTTDNAIGTAYATLAILSFLTLFQTFLKFRFVKLYANCY